MKFNSISRIKSDGGQWLVLVDNGTEGISVEGQYEVLTDAIDGALTCYGTSKAIVWLPDIHLSAGDIDVPASSEGERLG